MGFFFWGGEFVISQISQRFYINSFCTGQNVGKKCDKSLQMKVVSLKSM